MGTKRVGWARIKSLINENQNELKTRNHEVLALDAAGTLTLTAAQSGVTIYWTHSTAHNVRLPVAAPGLNFTFIIAEHSGTNAEHKILVSSTGSDKIYGKSVVVGIAGDIMAIQNATKGSTDKIKLQTNQTDTGGLNGDIVQLWCNEAGYWIADCHLQTTGTPGTIATIH